MSTTLHNPMIFESKIWHLRGAAQGKVVTVQITIKTQDLATFMAARAMQNKGRKAIEVGGLVTGKIIKVEEG